MKTAFAILLLLTSMPTRAADVIRDVLPSSILGEDRPLNIVLPEIRDTGGTYPVVYALDGDADDIREMAASLHAGRPDLIIVGVENVYRGRDMFPEEVEERRSRGGGGGAAFLEFLTTELIPHVETRYPAGGRRILCGQSNSAFFVLYALQTRPEAFQAWLAISPMIGWDEDFIAGGTRALFESRGDMDGDLCIIYGDDDFDRVTRYVPGYEDLLQATAGNGFRWQVEVIAGGGHVPVGAHERGIRFIFEEKGRTRSPGQGDQPRRRRARSAQPAQIDARGD